MAKSGYLHTVWAYYHPYYGRIDGPSKDWMRWAEPLFLGGGYGMKLVPATAEVSQALRHDPGQFLSPGRRDCYSAYYPTLGLYDCLDEATLVQQARWSRQAGLDGLIWVDTTAWEPDEGRQMHYSQIYGEKSRQLMLEVLRKEKSPLRMSILYDGQFTPRTIEQRIEDLSYLARTYHGHRQMLQIDGRLGIWIYGALGAHKAKDWEAICDGLRKAGMRDKLMLIAGEVWVYEPDFRRPGIFDGFYAYNQGVNFLNPADIKDLALTMKKLAEVNQAPFWCATVQPGFDGRIWHHPGRVVARGLGELYESLWQAAIETSPPLITVCSFNEWGEGTQIEPAQEYGDLFLKLTRKWARKYKTAMRIEQG